jgi:drug/metabolite transporter (DMT)-like permease
MLRPASTRPRALVIAAFATIYLVWGSTYLAIRWAVESIPPFTMMAVRSLIAALLLFGIARLVERREGKPAAWPTRAQWRAAAVDGLLLFAISHGALAMAETRVTSGVAALGFATLPLWLVALQALSRRRERPTRRALIGVLVGFLGVVVLVGDPRGGNGSPTMDIAGLLLVNLSAFAWAVGSLHGRHAAKPDSAIMHTGAQLLVGGLSLAVIALAFGEAPQRAFQEATVRSIGATAYLIVFGSILAFTAFNWLMRVSTPARVGTYAFVNPAVAVLLGWAIGGEALTVRMTGALAIILLGVGLVTTERHRSAERLDAMSDEQ